MSNTDSITIRPDFKEKLTSFFAGCQRIHAQYCAARGYSDDTKWNMTWLKRYVRVEQSISGSSSCHSFCFVDIDSGEVLKTGGWKAPAITKTKRGNISTNTTAYSISGRMGCSPPTKSNRRKRRT